jgi:hypothetical protein
MTDPRTRLSAILWRLNMCTPEDREQWRQQHSTLTYSALSPAESKHNAEFIACAPDDIAFLLTHVNILNAEIERLRAMLHLLQKPPDGDT